MLEVSVTIEHAITRERIEDVERLIRSQIRRTPVLEIDGSDLGLNGCSLSLKLEHLQRAGSFKTRGAFANLLCRDVPPVGVVAASGGNHGVAVAFAAEALGVPASIFVPSVSSPAKIDRIRLHGAKLSVVGERYADALTASEDYIRETNAMSVHAFDQDETILGQGTVGMEMEEQAPNIDTLLVSVGGGGLIAGVAAWYEQRIKIVGVEPELSPTLTRATAVGSPVDANADGIASDSLAPRRVGERVFPITQTFVDEIVLVSDQAIRNAQRQIWSNLRMVVEPGGVAATAALLSGSYSPDVGERVGVIISGGNTVAVDFGLAE